MLLFQFANRIFSDLFQRGSVFCGQIYMKIDLNWLSDLCWRCVYQKRKKKKRQKAPRHQHKKNDCLIRYDAWLDYSHSTLNWSSHRKFIFNITQPKKTEQNSNEKNDGKKRQTEEHRNKKSQVSLIDDLQCYQSCF